MALLTDQILATGVTLQDLIHIVIPTDVSQNPAGSSYKATIQQVGNALSGASFNTFTTGGTYDNGTALITFTKNDATTYTVDLSSLDLNDTFVTGATYNNSNTFTYTNNSGGTFDVSFDIVTGLTINGTLSATTLDGNTILSGGTNLTTVIESLDTYVTGGTVSISATDNDNDGTIGLFYKNTDGIPRTLPFEDTFTTGGTYDNGTALITFNKNDGTSYTVNLSSLDLNDTFVTGGTYLAGTATFTNNTGGTFNVTGFTQPFTGNTSGDCITDIFVSNIHSCSPLNINPLDEGNVYFGSTSGVTFDLTNNRVGIGESNPDRRLVVSGQYAQLSVDTDRNAALALIQPSERIYFGGNPSGMTGINLGTEINVGLDIGQMGSLATNPNLGIFGNPYDTFIRSNSNANNLNIITANGSGKEDSIRFYAKLLGNVSANTSSLHIQGSGSTKGYIGINNDNPEYRLDVLGSYGRFYNDLDTTGFTQSVLSGNSSGLTTIQVTSPSVGSVGFGIRGVDQTLNPGYGKVGDSFFYSSVVNNGINLVSAPGSGTDDYIRFYAGQLATTGNTPDLYIQGSGSTRGYIGINTANPLERLQIDDTFVFHSLGNKYMGYNTNFIAGTGDTRIVDGYSNTVRFSTPLGETRLDVSTSGNSGSTISWLRGLTVSPELSGSVSVGPTSPQAKLHINNTTSGNTFLAEDSTNPDSTPFVIDASGNTGIGTATPSEKLDVSGKTKTINFQMTSGATPGYVLTSDASGNASWQASTFTGNTSGTCITDLYVTNLYGCSPLHIEPSGVNDVYIVENGGNVGIGTNTPFSNSKVNIESNLRNTLNIGNTGSDAVIRNGITVDSRGTGSSILGNIGIQTMARLNTSNNYGIQAGTGGVFQAPSTSFVRDIGVQASASPNPVGGNIAAFGGQVDQPHSADTYGIYINVQNGGSGDAYIGRLTDGNQGAGKVLTSDSFGRATWQNPTSGGVTIDPYYTEPSAISITWDVSGNSTNYQTVLTANTTLNLSNVRNGDYGTIIVQQDGVGSRTITFGTVNGAGSTHRVVNGGGGVPTLTSNPNAIDILSFTYNGSAMYWTVGNDYT